jgi:magnesium transporter
MCAYITIKAKYLYLIIALRRVNPMYYVGFSSCTILASLILFQGFNTTGGTNTISLLAGFAVTFLGVHLLNLSRKPEPTLGVNGHSTLDSGLMHPRISLQGRMSIDGWNGTADLRGDGGLESGHGRRSSLYRAQSTTLFNAFEEDDPNAVPLDELREEDEDDEADERTRLHHSHPIPSRSHSGSPHALQGSARNSPRPT